MKQLSVYDFYSLGEALQPLSQWAEDTLKSKVRGQARRAYEQLTQAVAEDSVLLPASRDAAKVVIQSLELIFGENIARPGFGYDSPAGSGEESDKMGISGRFPYIHIHKFETIFRADLPRMTVFAAEQKGLYQTERLIDNAEDHFPAAVRKRLPKQAKTDLHFAGKCLAFDTPTACAFHVWRALEIVFGVYYVSITSRTFEDDKIGRNWFKYIEALKKAGADEE
jgi:hypothetical protein